MSAKKIVAAETSGGRAARVSETALPNLVYGRTVVISCRAFADCGGIAMADWVDLVISGDPRIIAGFVSGAFVAVGVGFKAGKVFGNWTLHRKFTEAERQLTALKGSLNDSALLWLRSIDRPKTYVSEINNSKPIITVVNLKGGVGKTTIAANLVAYFSQQKKRDGTPLQILVIDFDYQGSLSEMMLRAADIDTHEMTSSYLIDPNISNEMARAKAMHLRPKYENVWFYAAYEEFLELENRLMMQWITNPDSKDVRYELHRKLQSAGFMDAFDLVIIDGPPRMTTGFVEALCASTHLLMPTIPDKLSAPAAIRFLKQLEDLKPELFPATRLLGIVPSRTYAADSLTQKETLVIDEMISDLQRRHQIFDINIFRDIVIPNTASFIKSAGTGFAFFDTADSKPRDAISKLGAALKERITLESHRR
jgi:chromosome partitioning protein